MHCVINYGTNVSLWINNDCTEYELREGNFDLSISERIITKAIALNKIKLDMCSNEYETYLELNGNSFYIKTGLKYNKLNNVLRLVFVIKFSYKTFNIEYIAPVELLIFHYFNSDKSFYENKIVQFLLGRALIEAFNEFGCDLPKDWIDELIFPWYINY